MASANQCWYGLPSVSFFMMPTHCARRICGAWTAVFCLLFCSTGYSETLGVTVVQSEGGGPYTEFSDALKNILSGKRISLVVIDSASPIPNSGLVIGVGMKAAAAIAASTAPAALNVMIPKIGYEKLTRDFPSRSGSHAFSAIFLDQPVYRQSDLIAAIFPDKHNVGLLYSSPPRELAQLTRNLKEHGFNTYVQEVSAALPFEHALQNILDHSDVLLAVPDDVVYNKSTLRNILMETYHGKVPLIGISAGFVRAGALAAVVSTPSQIAAQTAVLIGQFGDSHVLAPAQYPNEFEVMVNEQVARSLGMQIKKAPALQKEIIDMESRKP